MPGDIFFAADRHQKELAARERAATKRLLVVYGDAYRAIAAELERVGTLPLTLGREVREARLQAMLIQMRGQIAQAAAKATELTTAEQRALLQRGVEHTHTLLALGPGPAPAGVSVLFDRPATQVLETFAGFASDGSPLRGLFDSYGAETARQMERTIAGGIGVGEGPRAIARKLRDVAGSNAVQALRLSRTEALRAYRHANLETMRANADVVEGWVWHSAKGRRTCPACWGLHGTFHELREGFAGHPNCRCSAVPHTKSWEELGFEGIPDRRAARERGAELFASLAPSQQRDILGPAKYDAFAAGEVELEDFVATKRSRRWGPMHHEASLEDAREAAMRRRGQGRLRLFAV